MSRPKAGEREGGPPLIAVVCRTPIVGEALRAQLESVADVRGFPAGRGDTRGLLRSLQPDGIVVDSEEEAQEAAAFARGSRSPVVHIALRERKLRVLRSGRWQEPPTRELSAQAVRNALLGGIFGRRTRK